MAIAAIAVLSLVGGLTSTPPPGPTSSGSAVAAATSVVGPIVYSEVLDAEGSALIERRLDGHSLPRRVAVRTNVDYGRTWSVDPRGTIAVALVPGRRTQRLEAISIADGTDLWELEMPSAQLDEAVWSADGRRIAVLSRPDEAGPIEAFVIDARDGHLLRAVVPEGVVIQGFDADDALILRERERPAQAASPTWRFFRVDPATNVVERLIVPPAVGPGNSDTDDADPARGLGVIATPGPNDKGTAIKVWPLGGGDVADPGGPAVDRSDLDRSSRHRRRDQRGACDPVRGRDGATDLWTGPDGIASFTWSAEGDYLGVATDARGPNLAIVERATGRAVDLPQFGPVAQSLLVRIVGGVPLPEPGAAGRRADPRTDAGPGGSRSGRRPGPGRASARAPATAGLLHVERLVPTSRRLRVAGAMPPSTSARSLGRTKAGRWSSSSLGRIRPRFSSGPRRPTSAGWLWDGETGPARVLALPRDWPAAADTVAWRPDGAALAATRS